MSAYDTFFKENIVKLTLGKKKIQVSSIDIALKEFKAYCESNGINSQNDLLKKDGNLTVDNNLIAVFSYEGRLWSTDEEEVVWR